MFHAYTLQLTDQFHGPSYAVRIFYSPLLTELCAFLKPLNAYLLSHFTYFLAYLKICLQFEEKHDVLIMFCHQLASTLFFLILDILKMLVFQNLV